MECQRFLELLVVLTLLQLCRAEIQDTLPKWYAANMINDGFQPKSISEIFSTEATFSSANPIIVESKVNKFSEDVVMLSTLPPPTSQAGTYGSDNTKSTQSDPVSPTQQQHTPHLVSYVQSKQTAQQVQSTQGDYQTFSKAEETASAAPPTQPQRNVKIEPHTSSTQTLSVQTLSTPLASSSLFPNTWDVETKVDKQQYMPQNHVRNLPNLSNYFLLYQPAPQGFPSALTSSSLPSIDDSFSTTSPPISNSYPATFSSAPAPFASTISAYPSSPATFSTTISPYPSSEFSSVSSFSSPLPSSTPDVSITSVSTIGSSPINSDCCTSAATPHAVGRPLDIFPLKIRVVSPSGSITNVNINPSTRKPLTTLVTRKPTTRRTSKPKKNTYERCLQGCRKNVQSICAAPLAQHPIDPKTLRGFPSVCHMACHNSYKKDPYEHIVDGSCGKLRTRIRPLDSNTKLKRDELHKVEYTIDHSGQKATVEFVPNNRFH